MPHRSSTESKRCLGIQHVAAALAMRCDAAKALPSHLRPIARRWLVREPEVPAGTGVRPQRHSAYTSAGLKPAFDPDRTTGYKSSVKQASGPHIITNMAIKQVGVAASSPVEAPMPPRCRPTFITE
ncbi:hypothetical protein DL767_009559 [Monosporascus sp. MG133]|nr:hypothetical protein DL767_009559 [Monosporascus sp. MG133]